MKFIGGLLLLIACGLSWQGAKAHEESGNEAVAFVQGSGAFTTGGTAVTRFVINASVDRAGNGSGSAVFSEAGGARVEIDVDCVEFLGAGEAVISGRDTSEVEWAFTVTDGGGAQRDLISLPQQGQDCTTFDTAGLFVVRRGDVVVQE